MTDIESMVFTRIYDGISDRIKTKYDMSYTNFSTESSIPKDATFPFVYIHLLPAIERFDDLNGITLNGGLFTVQVDITDDSDPSISKEIMDEVVFIMKGMRFKTIAMPEFQYDSSSLFRQTARFRRLIGSGDTL